LTINWKTYIISTIPFLGEILGGMTYYHTNFIITRKSIFLHNSKESRNFSHHKLTKKHFSLASEGVKELQKSSWLA
jgi:hypothetical protein